jgi:hypothetical protein
LIVLKLVVCILLRVLGQVEGFVLIDRLCGLVVRVLGYRSGGPGFDSRHYKKIVGLQRGQLSLVSATEELLGSNSSGSSLEIREYSRRDSSRWPRGTLYPQKVGTSFADKRRSLGLYSSLADWGHGVFWNSILIEGCVVCWKSTDVSEMHAAYIFEGKN